MKTHYVNIFRYTQVRIEVVDRKKFAQALRTYWKERDVFNQGETGFLQHLALLSEQQGIVPDELKRFGCIIRAEEDDSVIVFKAKKRGAK